MRRSIAVLALVLTLWPHIAVMRCAGPTPSSASPAASMMPDHHHGAADCPALMACTAVMIESVRVAGPVEASGPTVRVAPPRSLPPVAADLTREPPPPRRNA